MPPEETLGINSSPEEVQAESQLAIPESQLDTPGPKETPAVLSETQTVVPSPVQLQAAAYPPVQAAAFSSPQPYSDYPPPPPYTPAKTDKDVTPVVTQPKLHPIAQGRSMYAQDDSSDYATTLAYCTCAFVLFFGCWWSLPCTLAAVILALTVRAQNCTAKNAEIIVTT